MHLAAQLAATLALGVILMPHAGASPAEKSTVPPKITEHRFGPFGFQPPAGFRQTEDRTEEIPSDIPGAPPTREHFRSYAGPDGQGIYLFCWDGLPWQDRGPMKIEQTWEVAIGGQPGKVSRTEIFFGTRQRVLVAHFKSPNGAPCMIYQKTASIDRAPSREAFLALLATIRFEPAYIGSATMQPDGTIKLQLRATDGAGAVGHALLSYPRSHPEYQDILKHLGGLKPGQQKPVPPFLPSD